MSGRVKKKSKKLIAVIVIIISVFFISSGLSLYEFHTFNPISSGVGLIKVLVFHKPAVKIQSFPYKVYVGKTDIELFMKSQGYKLTDCFAPLYIFENKACKKVKLEVFRGNAYFSAWQIE